VSLSKFFVIESKDYVFAPYLEGIRMTALVRSTNVIIRSNDGMSFSNADVPDMTLNVMFYQDVYYVVNVTMYKNENVLLKSIHERLALLTDSDWKNLKMRKMEFLTFSDLYKGFEGDYVYRHNVDDKDQGLLKFLEIEEYRNYIFIQVTLEEAEKQKVEIPPIEAGTVIIEINLEEENNMNIFQEKNAEQCSYKVALSKYYFEERFLDLSYRITWKELNIKKKYAKTTRIIHETV